MKKKSPSNRGPTSTEMAQWRKKAHNLINSKRTLVLATSMDNAPWATPVYYLYADAAFYFFSSPDALHTRQALSGSASAAAIYADGDRLDQIEGIQMIGAVTPVQSRMVKLSVAARYLAKFPLAQALLGDAKAAIDGGQRATLFCFVPEKVHYMDNRSGFGKRLEIKL